MSQRIGKTEEAKTEEQAQLKYITTIIEFEGYMIWKWYAG